MVATFQVLRADGQFAVYDLKTEFATGAGAKVVYAARHTIPNATAQGHTPRLRMIGSTHAGIERWERFGHFGRHGSTCSRISFGPVKGYTKKSAAGAAL